MSLKDPRCGKVKFWKKRDADRGEFSVVKFGVGSLGFKDFKPNDGSRTFVRSSDRQKESDR